MSDEPEDEKKPETLEEHAKRIGAHFAAQADLFTQCRCGAHLRGTLEQIKAHRCNP